MRLLVLCVFLLAGPWTLHAGRETLFQLPTTSRRTGKAARPETEEAAFRDPFAAENPSAEASVRIIDPLEPLNRAFFQVNDKLYFWILKPAAQAYAYVAPPPVRTGVRRFFVNLRFPVRVVNNTLQGKLKGAGIETTRFVVNSTIGLVGFLDPAHDELRLDPQPEDFDQTLGFYGLPPGFYLHWPFLGASSLRGTVGSAGDAFLSPWTYLESLPVEFAIQPFETINATSLKLGEYEDFKKASFDPYVALRSAYFENRRSLISQ